MSIGELFGWGTILVALLVAFVLGAAPVFAVRLIGAIYPKNHPRRPELIAESAHVNKGLRHIGEQWRWLGEMFGLAVVEGVPLRWASSRRRLRGSYSVSIDSYVHEDVGVGLSSDVLTDEFYFNKRQRLSYRFKAEPPDGFLHVRGNRAVFVFVTSETGLRAVRQRLRQRLHPVRFTAEVTTDRATDS
ncbi:hypothetical protein AYK61_26580 [Rhodococcus sp. SBT000017]|uniref:hypothetical protein n=1 Tax=Rhodococcus sp. SBT000017 TaxID=1803385 RepID=UPI000EF8D5E4|nr:hypothetical protein [Rhodococcus sp. SBT000017]RMB69717.1 hypothetical protein AYK61_26580 [Rhodococcus sp. SBT000017]